MSKIIAIISPSKNAYSETFIQSQKNGLQGKILYYYGGNLPMFLEGYGKLRMRLKVWDIKIKRQLGIKTLNIDEACFIHSLKKNKVQVVLAQYGTTAHRIVALCKQIQIPLITHFHGYDASVSAVINNCNNYREIFEYSHYIIAVSRSMENKLISLGCPSEKLIYNPCAPDISFSKIEPQFSEPLFIGLGRFVPKKAPYYIILAFKRVLEKFPNAKLVLGGNGELYEVCKNLVRYLQLENNVTLPGVLSKEEFMGYLSKGLAFVQHSVTAINGDQEGTPVAVLEASAAGLPVLSTFHAGIPDVIIDGKTGMLVPEHDADGMAENMLQLLEDKTLAQKMGMNGQAHIKNHFSLEKHLQTLEVLIEKVIRNSK